MQFGLSEIVLNKIYEITKKFDYDFYIFGSRARGDYKKNSDIDIAVYGDVNEEDKPKIKSEFDEINTPYIIDVLFIMDLKNEELINNIEKEGVML